MAEITQEKGSIRIDYKMGKAVNLVELNALQGELKTLSDGNYQKLRNEIINTGFAFAPHVWRDKNNKLWLVDGHQRCATLNRMVKEGFKVPKIPVVEVSAKSLKEAKIRVLQGVSQYGEFQPDFLPEFLPQGLSLDEIDLRFSLPDFELGDFKTEPVEGEDDVPDFQEIQLRKKKIVNLGDVYILGAHRLMCGDATKVMDVENLMQSEKADITFTSPPYNAGCFWFQGGKDKYKGTSDDKNQDEYYQFLMGFTSIAMEVSGVVLVNNQFLSGNIHALAKYIGSLSDELKDVFCWVKNTAPPNISPGVFTNRWEAIYAFEKGNKKKGFPVKWQGKFANVIEGETAAKENDNSDIHQATMPTYLPLWFLERLDYVKSVYEPFAGTGTTAIACEKTNRKCFMMELDPGYCHVILDRWATFTGNDPVRSDGKKWSVLKGK